MLTNPTNAPLHFDHLGDPDRSVVQMKRIGNIVQIVSWTVHGAKAQALHDINTLKTCEVEQLHDAVKWIKTMAAQVLEARAAVGDEVGVVVVGAGRERAL